MLDGRSAGRWSAGRTHLITQIQMILLWMKTFHWNLILVWSCKGLCLLSVLLVWLVGWLLACLLTFVLVEFSFDFCDSNAPMA